MGGINTYIHNLKTGSPNNHFIFEIGKGKEATEIPGPKERERSLGSTAKIEPGLAMSSKAKNCGHSPFGKE